MSDAAGCAALPSLPISSPRLELRALAPQDAQLYGDLYTDPHTMRCIGPALSAQQAARSFRAALRGSEPPRRGPLFLTIVERASQLSLGLCAIQPIAQARAETGVIVSAAARGRGIATESLRAVIDWALERWALERVWVRISTSNHVAERLVRAVGLQRAAAHAAAAAAEPPEVIWYADRNAWPRKQGEH